MSLSPYPKYKPSGVEWLGDVPAHWEVKRGRFCANVNPQPFRSLHPNSEVSFVPMEAVGEYGGLNLDQKRSVFEVSSGYTEFKDGDVVVAKITPCFENGKGALATGLLNGIGFGTTELHVLRPFANLDVRFLFYFSISQVFRNMGEGEMYGAGGQKRVPPEFCKDIHIPLPPVEEQNSIADLLDRETAKIDTLVAKKRTLIERLKEERTALITHTVTRGLPPEAARAAGLEPHPKLKPSGVEWLGEVPTHWEIVALRRYAKQVQTGSTPPTVEERFYENGSIPWYGPASFDDQIVVTRPVKMIHESAVREGVVRCFAKGTTLVVTIGATLGKVSSLDAKGSCNQQITAIEFDPKIIYPRFATYQIKRLELIFRAVAPRATLPILDQNEIADTILALPPPREQEIIAAFLDRQTAKIDTLVTKIETAIERLQEYRSALITAAVTGEIDVREEAAL